MNILYVDGACAWRPGDRPKLIPTPTAGESLWGRAISGSRSSGLFLLLGGQIRYTTLQQNYYRRFSSQAFELMAVDWEAVRNNGEMLRKSSRGLFTESWNAALVLLFGYRSVLTTALI